MELVTGYAGKGHVTSADAGRLNAGICGLERYVLNTGEMFGYEVVSNNEIVIKSGDLVDQGRQISIPQGTTESVKIDTGSNGKARYDAIVARYSKDTSTGVESASLLVIKGKESEYSSEPQYPELVNGSIYDGDPVDDTVLYYIKIHGLSIVGVKKAYTTVPPLSSIVETNKRIDELIGKISKKDVTLWSGSLSAINKAVTLADDINNYDYIDIYIGRYNDKFARRFEAKNGSYVISIFNTPDNSAAVDFMDMGEVQVSLVGNKMTILRNRLVRNQFNKYTIYEDNDETVNRIVGIKYADVSVDYSEQIEELKKSVSDGKLKLAEAITDKGVDTASTDRFATMAENVGKIEIGGGVKSTINNTKSTVSDALNGMATSVTSKIVLED